MQRRSGLIRTAVVLAAAAVGSSVALGQTATPTEAELARKLEQLAAELATVKAQLAALQQQRAAQASQPAADAASAPSPAPTPAPMASETTAAAGPPTVFSGYAEINYNRPSKLPENAQADLRRFVLGVQHRFDPATKMVAELEVEHAVSSADDPGEVALEQAYVEHQLGRTWSVQGGLFLIPMGLLNETHEPTAYYGVERNFVETAIIPTTWREGGVQMVGQFGNGITLQTGISTGFDLTKWDATSTEGQESPLGAIHQEMALAKAHDLSVFGAVNWRGMPGLLVGGSVFTGNATQGQTSTSSRVTLWDAHARWTPGRWDLSALYSRGTISDTAALNAPLVGNPSLIPSAFDGYYVQGAYKLWTRQDYSLAPFVRWERFNTGKSYADLGPGLTPPALPTETVWTAGANFQVTPGVVVKADYQWFSVNKNSNRFDLGLGWSF
ncbi:MAG TPA: porin [Burkholderiaceae bacterium]|nr:porin [Burkholderiaceae bacterium]